MLANPLVDAVQQLSLCRDLPAVMEVLRSAARTLTGADGVTVVLREGDCCHYADENAIAPLWKGKRFPLSACISGWAMLHRRQVAIPDIYADPRIPHDAYRPTFVRSLAMTPIRTSDPMGAIGAYWASHHTATDEELTTLQALGDAASVAFENVRLIESLTAANRHKDDFLLMLAHELRNPLVPVRNAAHVLHARSGGDASAEKAYQMVERQMGHMERILDDLLAVARLTRGMVEIQHQRIDIARELRMAADDARDAMHGAGLVFEVAIPETPVWVMGDAVRITQVAGNVLDNARKFTPPQGKVMMTLERDRAAGGDAAIVRIADTGAGIDGALLPRIFDAFAQADRSLARTGGGLGLGLAVARGIVELHGGTISATSEGPGRGAELTIRLPAIAEPAALVDQPIQFRTRGGAHVLIVEDNLDAAESLRMILEVIGFTVSVAHTGPDGVAAAKATRPANVVCDIGLPGFDGFTVAEQLRGDPATANTRLIAVTGYGSEDDQERTARAGFDVHLVKPVRPDRLIGHLVQAA